MKLSTALTVETVRLVAIALFATAMGLTCGWWGLAIALTGAVAGAQFAWLGMLVCLEDGSLVRRRDCRCPERHRP